MTPPLPPFTFPDPRHHADEDGIVAVTPAHRRPSIALLQTAYRQGIFPWPIPEAEVLPWFCPDPRAILEFDRLKIPPGLRSKSVRPGGLKITIDRAFTDVIAACALAPRPGQPGTWITPELIASYLELHSAGIAHSVEAWDAQGALVGGLYGVDAGGAFAGESMFHRVSDASKLCLLHLIRHLQAQGLDWMDIQMLTPHLEKLGAREVSRDEFLTRLSETQAKGLSIFPAPPAPAGP